MEVRERLKGSDAAEILARMLAGLHNVARPMKPLLFLVLALLTANASAAGRPKLKRNPLLPPIAAPTDHEAAAKIYTTSLGGKDLRFLTDAIELGLGQVFLAGLAGNQAQADRVKALASVLSQTQREENSRLARLAASKDVNFRSSEAAGQEGLARKFAKLTGEKFDSVWIEEIVKLNLRAVANYSEAVESSDPDIAGFAQKALPLAKEKLALVTGGGGGVKGPAFRTEMSQPQPR